MAISQSDIDALDAAIVSGALSVEFDGRRITYQNTAQLIAARAHAVQVTSGSVRRTVPYIFGFRFTTSRGD
jgi:hypothetical protein